MYCIYLRKRKNKPFCKFLNKEISFYICRECDKKIYKTKTGQKSFYKIKKSTLEWKNAQKTGRIVHKLKRETSKHRNADSKRFSIITNDLEHCIVCGAKKEALHEVFYGSYRHNSIKYGLVIPLCENHHTKDITSIHKDRQFDLSMKFLAQKVFVEKYSINLFIEKFGMNYIEKYKHF